MIVYVSFINVGVKKIVWLYHTYNFCVRFLYKRRCKEDCLVVPYIQFRYIVILGCFYDLQRVTKHGFEMYLAKYISKPESSFDVKLSKNQSAICIQEL